MYRLSVWSIWLMMLYFRLRRFFFFFFFFYVWWQFLCCVHTTPTGICMCILRSAILFVHRQILLLSLCLCVAKKSIAIESPSKYSQILTENIAIIQDWQLNRINPKPHTQSGSNGWKIQFEKIKLCMKWPIEMWFIISSKSKYLSSPHSHKCAVVR